MNKVRFVDDDHVYVDGVQYISLNRLAELKQDMAKELKMVLNENKTLREENEAFKVLLKNQLNEE